MDKKISTSNTKAQIMDAYNEVLKKLEEKSQDNPKEVQQRKEAINTVESAQKNSEEGIVKDINKIKTSFIESLGMVEGNLKEEHNKLADIQAAINIEKKHLEDLYGISTNADSFAAILLAQNERREKFEEEIKATKGAFENEIKEAKEAFDNKMSEAKVNWVKEKSEKETLLKEEREQTHKARKREEEEYNYSLQQKRNKETDIYELKKLQLESTLKEKRLAFEKEFAEREKELLENEKEFAMLKKEAEQFPKQLETAVKGAVVELKNQLSTEFKYEKDLLSKETEGIINLKDLQISTLGNKIKEMDAQLKTTNQKAEVSEKSAKEIAIKAIESSKKVQVIERDKFDKE